METTGIDLTKCNNCLFRAVYNGRPVSGTVKVGEEWCNLNFDGGIVSVRVSGLPEDSGIADFEIVPRDPETYKDWQVGDVIYSLDDEGNTVSGEDEMGRVIFRSGELVAIAVNYSAEEADINGCYTCSQLFQEGWRLVLTDIEQQIIEEKKKYEPQDGDIVAWKDKEDDGDVAITIYRGNHRGYFTLFASGKSMGDNKYDSTLDMNIFRPATDEEKQMLFEAMAKNGKRWNAEKKVVEKISNSPEFKAKEVVMVRDAKERWKLMAFVAIGNGAYKYEVTNGEKFSAYKQCIPYNEKTMHLLGTGEDYKEDEK